MSGWIDFRELRGRLDFEQVLRHFRVEVKRKGDQHHGYCPLPNHNGKRNSPSFSANLKKGIFQCFGCGAKGNILEFAALMSNVSLEDGPAFRKIASELEERFCPRVSAGSKAPTPKKEAPSEKVIPRVINAPLDFELKGLDPTHPYFASRGFTRETVDYFGLGFCSRGMLQDRIAIPLHDSKGRLVGYSGRVVDDSTINEENPRYRLPAKRERKGVVFEFRKTMFLYNGFRFKEPLDELIVVEGFTSVWWLHQNGFPNVVATMGSDCSERQGELIVALVKPSGRVWLLPDADEAGERCAVSLLTNVAHRRFARCLKLQQGQQPTDLPRENLSELFVS